MEKTENIKKEEEYRLHKFYCDKCEEFLGQSIEEYDGYYEEFGACEYRVIVNGKWFTKKANLCNKHKKEFEYDYVSALISFGFES